MLLLFSGGLACNPSHTRQPVWSLTFPERAMDRKVIVRQASLYCVTASVYSATRLTLSKVAAEDGHIIWQKGIEAASNLSSDKVLIGEGVLVYRTPSGSVKALDVNTGNQEWENQYFNDLLAIANQRVYVADKDWRYCVLDSISGSVVQTGNSTMSSSCRLVIDNGRQYFVNKGRLVASDLQTGRTLWEYQAPGAMAISQIASALGNLYASNRNELSCLDEETGAVRWRYPFSGDVPELVGNDFYVAEDTKTEGTKVVKLDAQTGAAQTVLRADIEFGSDRRVFFRDGAVYNPISETHYGYNPIRYLVGEEKALSRDAWMTAISVTDGHVLWSSEKYWCDEEIKPIIGDGRIVFAVSGVNLGNSSKLVAYPMK
jgi:outer membrane protein assembly factor BamB